MLCDEHGGGGSGEYFGIYDAHLDITNVFYHLASGGKYVSRAAIFDLEPGVIDAARARHLSASSSVRETSLAIRAGKTGQRPLPKG